MSLNPEFSEFSCVDPASSKLSISINAFNGNTTNFNRCPRPAPKANITPIQPRYDIPDFSNPFKFTTVRPF